MNQQYKEAVKDVGPNDNSRFKKHDTVMHWFRGKGTVLGVKGDKTVIVHFEDSNRAGKRSECWAKHLYRI